MIFIDFERQANYNTNIPRCIYASPINTDGCSSGIGERELIMTSTSKSGKTHIKTYKLIVVGILVVVLCLAPIFLRGLRHPLRLFFPNTFKRKSPELTKCTRIEIQLPPYWFFKGSGVINDEENKQRENSFKSIMLIDPNDIKELANLVASAEFMGLDTTPFRFTEYNQITGYVDSKPSISFIIHGSDLRLKNNRGFYIFRNSEFQFYFDKIASDMLPFQRRIYCSRNLESLRRNLIKAIQGEKKYPAATEWCDFMEQYQQSKPGYPAPQTFTWRFKCPELRGEGRCNYAMNPNCKLDSPGDMVLLFEAKPGWNQHGGPELFTFDNHDPKGGCVVLNDGTVKFIRTKEELQQLRWK
jgi:hypothetical protein